MTDVHVAGFDDLPPRTAYALWALRVQVFVVEQRCPYPELDGRDPEPGTRHAWIEEAGEPIAYLRLLEDADGWLRIGRVVVAAGHRGRGLAGTLMEVATGLVGDRASRLDAQSHLTAFYRRFGYADAGPEFLEDGIPHVPMTRPGPAAGRVTGRVTGRGPRAAE